MKKYQQAIATGTDYPEIKSAQRSENQKTEKSPKINKKTEICAHFTNEKLC